MSVERGPSPALAGTRLLVTARRRGEELAAALVRRGAEVDRVPTVDVVPAPDDPAPVDPAPVDPALVDPALVDPAPVDPALVRRTRDLVGHPPDLLVVTTGFGFRSWLAAAGSRELADDLLAVLAGARLVARGPKAREALREAGLTPDWVAEADTCAEIAELLLEEGVAGLRVAVQHHGAGATGMDGLLRAAGAEVVPVEVYRWGPPPDPDAVLRAAADLGRARYDGVLFTSAAGAAAWLRALDAARATDPVREQVCDGRLLLAAVGPVTAEPLGLAGLASVWPARSRLGALVRLVTAELGGGRRAIPTVHGALRIRARAVTLDHRRVPVSPSALAVLRRLAATPGRVVTREELLAELPGASRDPHAAEVAVARLRESLRAAVGDGRLVRTVVRRGYVLTAG